MTPWQIAIELRAAAAEECAERPEPRLSDEETRALKVTLAEHQLKQQLRARRFINVLIVALFVSLGLNWVQLALCIWK